MSESKKTQKTLHKHSRSMSRGHNVIGGSGLYNILRKKCYKTILSKIDKLLSIKPAIFYFALMCKVQIPYSKSTHKGCKCL